MVQAAFGGLADVLLRGVDYAQQQRQRQLQQAALMQQLIGTPPPPTVDVTTPYGGIPMTADQLIKAGVFEQPAPPPPSLPGGFFADLHEATQTGDWSRFRQQWGDMEFPTADVARIFQAPQYAATAGLRGAEADEQRAGTGAFDTVITPEEAQYMGRPELAGRTYRQAILGSDVAAGVAGVEETRARTGLFETQALVAAGEHQLARDRFDWQKFMDETGVSERAREFAASEEGRLWQQGFEQRKQAFFEEMSRAGLSGEQADRAFNQWLQREQMDLERQAHQLRTFETVSAVRQRDRDLDIQESRVGVDWARLDRDRERDAVEDERYEREWERDEERWRAQFQADMEEAEFDRAMRQAEFDWAQTYQSGLLSVAERAEDRAAVMDEFNRDMQTFLAELKAEVDRGELSLAEAKQRADEEAQRIASEIAQAEDARAAERHAADMETRLLENEMLRIRTEHLPEELQAEIRGTVARATRDEAEARAVIDTLSYVIDDLRASTALDVARAAQIEAETATEEELRQVRYDLMMAEAEQALAAAGLSEARANEILTMIEPTLAKLEAETALAEAATETERARGAEAWQRVDDIGMEALWQMLGLPGEPTADIPVHRWQLEGMSRALLDSQVATGAQGGVPFSALAAAAGVDTSGWPAEVADAVVPVGNDPRALGEALQALSTGFLGDEVVPGPKVPEGSGAVQSFALQYAQAMSPDPQEQVKLADQWVQRLQSAYNSYLRMDQQQNMLFGGIRDRDAPPVLSLEEFAMHYYTGDPLPMGGPLQRLDATQQAWLYDALEQHGHPTAFKRYLEGLNTRQRRQILERFGMPATGWNDLMDIVSWIEQQALSEGMVMP